MAVTPRGTLLVDDASGTDASVSVPSDSEDTDLQVAFCGSNFFTLDSEADLQPSGPGWQLRFTVDRGADDSKVRLWTRTSPAGAHTVTLSTLGGEEIWIALRRLIGADLANPVDDVDGATAANGSHTAPALDLATEAYLLGAAMSAVFEGGGTYTPPSGFTELAEIALAAGSAHATVAEDQAAGPGAVGPFTFTYSQADPGLAVVIGIRPASTGTTVALGSAVEADAARSLAGRKLANADPASTLDAGRPLVAIERPTPSGAAEQDAARPLATSKTGHLSSTAEVDQARPVTILRRAAVAAAAESEAARLLTVAKSAHLTPATEIDQARPVTALRQATLAFAAEAGGARPMAAVKQVELDAARGADAADPAVAMKWVALGGAASGDAALPLLIPGEPQLLGAASTSDTARSVTAVLIRQLGPAHTTDAARSAEPRKLATAGAARERSRALALAAAGVTVFRPDTGTVTRPDTGVTVRPDTGLVLRP